MLDIKVVRQDPQRIATALAARGFSFDVAHFNALDARRKQADIDSQNLLAERKSASKKIGLLVGQGMNVDDAKAQVNESLEKIAAQLDALTEQARQAQGELEDLLLRTPNIPAEDVPAGRSEADNVEILRWGAANRSLSFRSRTTWHWARPCSYWTARQPVKITGSRFTVMYGNLARLHRALIQFMLNLHIEEHGYSEVYVPYIVNRESLLGTGQLPKFEEDLFKLRSEQDLYLIPTAEVPVTNIARDRIFEDAELGEAGLRFVCHTPCFRSEAGSYGRDTRGMIRQHQFEKVELVQLVRAQQSAAALEQLTAHAEKVLQLLASALPQDGSVRWRYGLWRQKNLRPRGVAPGTGYLPRDFLLQQFWRLSGAQDAGAVAQPGYR